MSKSSKISSRRDRVKRANQYIKRHELDISIIDREAYVEFFLLEDIIKHLEDYMTALQNMPIRTKDGKALRDQELTTAYNTVTIFDGLVEIFQQMLAKKNYAGVWSSIPESMLKRYASAEKNLSKLTKIAKALLENVSGRAEKSSLERIKHAEFVMEMMDNDANMRTVNDIESIDEINKLVTQRLSKEDAVPANVNQPQSIDNLVEQRRLAKAQGEPVSVEPVQVDAPKSKPNIQ